MRLCLDSARTARTSTNRNELYYLLSVYWWYTDNIFFGFDKYDIYQRECANRSETVVWGI